MCLYANCLYRFLINKCEGPGIKYCNDFNVFIVYFRNNIKTNHDN